MAATSVQPTTRCTHQYGFKAGVGRGAGAHAAARGRGPRATQKFIKNNDLVSRNSYSISTLLTWHLQNSIILVSLWTLLAARCHGSTRLRIPHPRIVGLYSGQRACCLIIIVVARAPSKGSPPTADIERHGRARAELERSTEPELRLARGSEVAGWRPV